MKFVEKFDVKEKLDYELRTPITVDFEWDICSIQPPNIDCSQFPKEPVGGRVKYHCNVNKPGCELIPEVLQGACYPPIEE